MSFHCFASTTWSIYWKKRVGFPERTSLVSSSCTLSKMLWTICTSLSVISSAGKIGSKSPQFPAVSVPVETCELKLLDQQVKKTMSPYGTKHLGLANFLSSPLQTFRPGSRWENMIHTLVINHMAFENPPLADDFTIQIAIFFRGCSIARTTCFIRKVTQHGSHSELTMKYTMRAYPSYITMIYSEYHGGIMIILWG